MNPALTLRQRLALASYVAAFRLLLPAMLLRYWLRGRKEPGYRVAMGERLGFGPALAPGAVWVHAVSLGETRACGALIEALLEGHRRPHRGFSGRRRPRARRA